MAYDQTAQRLCPVCGVALVGLAQDRGGKLDIFRCPRCGLVIDMTVPAKAPPDQGHD